MQIRNPLEIALVFIVSEHFQNFSDFVGFSSFRNSTPFYADLHQSGVNPVYAFGHAKPFSGVFSLLMACAIC